MQPSQQSHLIDRLAAIPYTGAISDILDEMGHAHQVLPSRIQSIQPGQTVVGRALTVLGEPATGRVRDEYFRPFLTMLGMIGPGDVVVIQPNDASIAHFGELSCETAKFRGGRGAIIDGGVRDVDYILKLGFPVFARYRTPQDIVGRWRVVDCDVPVTIGEVRIQPGDFVLGDRDGAVIIPQSAAREVIAKAEEVVHTENAVRKAILDGVHPVQAYEKFGRF
jgi:4-hydroxy-4-methyl-2-oxoglutarate aldolase